MKTLKFTEELVSDILHGNKRTTWRLMDDKGLSLNDEIEFVSKETLKAIGKGKILQLLIKQLSDITTAELAEHGYNSHDEMYAAFEKFYGKGIGPHTEVKIVTFSFEPYSQPQQPAVPTKAAIKEIKLYGDGGSRGNPGPSASGYVLLDMDDNILLKSGVYLGLTTNNQAEYQSLKFGLEEAKKYGATTVHVYMDSLLVINQMKGIFKVKNRDLWPIYQAIKDMITQFSKVTFTHVPRELNKLADAEVNTTLDAELQK